MATWNVPNVLCSFQRTLHCQAMGEVFHLLLYGEGTDQAAPGGLGGARFTDMLSSCHRPSHTISLPPNMLIEVGR